MSDIENESEKQNVNQPYNSDDEYFVNTNRPTVQYPTSSSSSSSDED